MIKLASFALVVAGAAGVATTFPAAACPLDGGYRSVALVRPIGYFPGHYRPSYVHDQYWHRDYWREGRFHREWERR
jgi:hypothetical protein